MQAWPLRAACGPHLRGHGALGQKDGVFLVPEVTSLPWKPPGRTVSQGGGRGLPFRVGPTPYSSHQESVT